MKNIGYLGLLLSIFLSCQSSFSQIKTAVELQKINKAAIRKGYAASVRIWGFDTVRKVQSSSQFSGVVVSANGCILTVSHAIIPNHTYKVRFPDGREVIAVALGRIGLTDMQNRPDLGMMKITSEGTWPVAEMGWSKSLKVNAPCVSVSYPESLNQLLPTVRAGRISSVANSFGFVESTCKMEPGDSGGPLFDGMGRVVAMHSRCREAEDENFEIPVDLYRKYWTALNVAEDYKTIPPTTSELAPDPLASQIQPSPFWTNVAPLIPQMLAKNKGNAVMIKSVDNGVEKRAVATLFAIKGKYFLVAKNSLIFADPLILRDGVVIVAKRLKTDIANDLVLLQAEGEIKGGIDIHVLKKVNRVTPDDLGSFLISGLPGGQRLSVLGSQYFSQPRKFSAGFLGAPARFLNGKVTLIKPIPGSPAELAGLEAGDQINTINKKAILKPVDYGDQLVSFDPGDTVSIQGLRGGNLFERQVILGPRPVGTHVADKFKGGKSIRADGFMHVLSHDPILRADECGGPVFDIKGDFYGINIARFSRTTTLIIPADIIRGFLLEEVN